MLYDAVGLVSLCTAGLVTNVTARYMNAMGVAAATCVAMHLTCRNQDQVVSTLGMLPGKLKQSKR